LRAFSTCIFNSVLVIWVLLFLSKSSTLILGTFIKISILSKIGHDNLDLYLSICVGLHTQCFSLSHKNQQGQGFRAQIKVNFAGYL
jgi:hypothetical protein